MRFRINALNIANFGTGIVLTLGVPLIYAKQLETLVGKFKANTEWELKPYKQKRSLSANNYFWVLADKIAEAIKSDKELVYWNLPKSQVCNMVILKNDSKNLGESHITGHTETRKDNDELHYPVKHF